MRIIASLRTTITHTRTERRACRERTMTTTTSDTDNDIQHDQALALGFGSAEECNAHQEWLNKQAAMRSQISAAVAKAFESGSNVIDVRSIVS